MSVRNSLIGSPIERLEDLRFLRGRGRIYRRRGAAAAFCMPLSFVVRRRTAASARLTLLLRWHCLASMPC